MSATTPGDGTSVGADGARSVPERRCRSRPRRRPPATPRGFVAWPGGGRDRTNTPSRVACTSRGATPWRRAWCASRCGSSSTRPRCCARPRTRRSGPAGASPSPCSVPSPTSRTRSACRTSWRGPTVPSGARQHRERRAAGRGPPAARTARGVTASDAPRRPRSPPVIPTAPTTRSPRPTASHPWRRRPGRRPCACWWWATPSGSTSASRS